MALPLNTTPGPSPDEESVRNMEIARHLLRQAQEELDRDDILQASEKVWGAAAHAVKAVAEKRRWFNDADWRLRKIVAVLTEEQQDTTLLGDYLTARDAHYNFYHHEFNSREVQQSVNAAGQLVQKLETLLADGNAPAPYVNDSLREEIRRLEQPSSTLDHQRLEKGRLPLDQRPPVRPESAEVED